jgi:8-amino-7-oxononanoate synthase
MLPEKLQRKLTARRENHTLRSLPNQEGNIDFSSNDYLGFARNNDIYRGASQILEDHKLMQTGATGSRLLSGNHALYAITENYIASAHNAQAALIFNSGYDANLGFFGSVPQRGDLVFYDAYIHASIRDGIQLGKAKHYKFPHNQWHAINDLVMREREGQAQSNEVYVVTESVFSMDGDSPDLDSIVNFCKQHKFHLVVDEAHALGVLGKGFGLVQDRGLEQSVFGRLVTFGKALGCHGAAILGSEELNDYLINFARSLIYTTALPPHAIASVLAAYKTLSQSQMLRKKLHENNTLFRSAIKEASIHISKNVETPIHCIPVAGNERVREASRYLAAHGFDVKPIVSPTVPEGKERLRICMHTFNTEAEILDLAKLINYILQQ